MSRYYEAEVVVTNYDPERELDIQAVCEEIWGFDMGDWWQCSTDIEDPDIQTQMRATARGFIGGGESEEEFANRPASEIWKTIRGDCGVAVDLTHLENIPHNVYTPKSDPTVLEDDDAE